MTILTTVDGSVGKTTFPAAQIDGETVPGNTVINRNLGRTFSNLLLLPYISPSQNAPNTVPRASHVEPPVAVALSSCSAGRGRRMLNSAWRTQQALPEATIAQWHNPNPFLPVRMIL